MSRDQFQRPEFVAKYAFLADAEERHRRVVSGSVPRGILQVAAFDIEVAVDIDIKRMITNLMEVSP